MLKRSRFTGLSLTLFGTLLLLANLDKPRVATLHGSDILALVGCGMCLGIGLMGLLGRLNVENQS